MSNSEDFFENNRDIKTVELFVVDLNGVPRGKTLPISGAYKVFKDGVRLPRSVYAMDVWGRDVLAAGLVAETGDNDGICVAVERTLARVPFLKEPTAQLIMSMRDAAGVPFFADPRQVLSRVLGLFSKIGLTPVVALELEFYLTDRERDANGAPLPPRALRSGRRSEAAHTYAIDELEDFSEVLNEISESCKLQNIPADAVISENGPGQFEINLNHVPDALRAADDAFLMKRVVRGVARKHGLDATFMAKPYGNCSGNGMHVHFSILDSSGKNIFAGKDRAGASELRYAIGGLMASMADSMAIFAPNFNSYRRLRPGSHAPTRICWSYDNRHGSLRIPESEIPATRIEHRVSGADANPHLLLAAILAGAYQGLIGKMEPVPPLSGNLYESNSETLPSSWSEALDRFQRSEFISRFMTPEYQKLYAACKLQEKVDFDASISAIEYAAYLRDI